VIAAPRHFTALARRLRWDPDTLDLAADGRAWPSLPAARRARLTVLLAGFIVAEASVAEEIEPFIPAAGNVETRDALAAQRADEQRHARLFDRIGALVLGLPGDGSEERAGAARDCVPRRLRDLFERRLPDTAAALAGGRVELGEAIGLYHMVIEGLVLSAGQQALLDDLADGALPEVRARLVRIERDERWHVGFGLRCLVDLRPDASVVAALDAAGDGAVDGWGDAVPAHLRRRAVAMHRRRLACVGLGTRTPVGGHAAAGSPA
jgi:ribonucleoside-diphosphate reductase beta chain